MKMWIARTPLGILSLHCFYPKYIIEEEEGDGSRDNCWINGHILYLDKRLFSEVTFENSPQEVELVIKK